MTRSPRGAGSFRWVARCSTPDCRSWVPTRWRLPHVCATALQTREDGALSTCAGALDFQTSATDYVHRYDAATLDQLMELAALVCMGEYIPEALAAAAQHGTSIGGAHPKAVLAECDRQLISKFSSADDLRPVVKTEGFAMLLAERAGFVV